MYHTQNTDLEPFYYFLNKIKTVFSSLAQIVAFGTALSFKIHQDCNFRLKLKEKLETPIRESIEHGKGGGGGVAFALNNLYVNNYIVFDYM